MARRTRLFFIHQDGIAHGYLDTYNPEEAIEERFYDGYNAVSKEEYRRLKRRLQRQRRKERLDADAAAQSQAEPNTGAPRVL